MTSADSDSGVEHFVTAAAQGDLSTLNVLLESSDDPSKIFARSLCAAAYYGHLEVIKLLASKGADLNSDDEGETALLVAIRGCQSKVIRQLIDSGADVQRRLPLGASALHQAVTTDQATKTEATLDIIDHLLVKGLDLEIRDDDGLTPLHEAALYGRVEILEGLIARGAKVNAKDNWQNNPFDLACSNSHLETVRVLISHGADVNAHSGGCKGLGRAARNGRLDLVTFLFANGANPVPASNEGPELLYAARSGVSEVVQALMDRGLGSQGPRSLLRAAIMDSVQVVAQLLDHGVCVEVKNRRLQTTLHAAVLGKRFERQTSNPRNEVIKLLMERGADLSARDSSGKTALTIATELGYTDTADILTA